MKKFKTIFWVFLLSLIVIPATALSRHIINIDRNWFFHLGDLEKNETTMLGLIANGAS